MRMFNFNNAISAVMSMFNGQAVVFCAKSNTQTVEPGTLRLYLRALYSRVLDLFGQSLFSRPAGTRDQKYGDGQILASTQFGHVIWQTESGSLMGGFAGGNPRTIALPARVDRRTATNGTPFTVQPKMGWRNAKLVMS